MTENNLEQLLSVGSVVYLKEGTLKVVVIARGQLVKLKENENKPTYFDYLGSLYPQGYDVDNRYYFNQEQIEKVVFPGYSDDEEQRYQVVLEEWKKANQDKYILMDEES
ncbi:DUF4176 domain-containing protein [Lactococcus termiticola]|uniref:DUF4176 domain-containing protein n=1 Tax=Lactococcus termiticola TaxID=2169526 RepID=A0A2R5HG93_9LACT|nr:DUF4176 domain-containing protein [Lactococcus termiticola]GBG97083.1 hypothetical protein NtB2_01220 [Lactococcus termiticola]